jgi:hypothetical protein
MGPSAQQSITGRLEVFGGETFIVTVNQRLLVVKRIAGSFAQQAAAATGQLSGQNGETITLLGSVIQNGPQDVLVID